MKIKLGRYTCEGQLPINVTSTGTAPEHDGHGPWVDYKIEYPPGSRIYDPPVKVFYTAFYGLLEFGYRHESEPVP